MNKTRKNIKIMSGAVAIAMVLAACGGSDGGDADADNEQICRIAQRLIDDQVDGDLDGVERQLERLEEIEGIDDLTDLNDIENLAEESGEDAAQDLADLFDDDLNCVVDVPEVADVPDATPPETVPVETTPATEPPVTEPPVTEPPVTDPPATDPPATDAPDTPAPTAEPGEALAVVEIGATGPGIDRPELARVPADAVTESGISVLPIPAGDAIAIEYSISYDVDTFSDSPAFSAFEEFTFTADTSMTIEEVRTAFADAITGSYDMSFDVTESSSSRDEITQAAVTLRPERSREGVPRYEVIVATSSEFPGVVLIEVTASDTRDGALPGLTPTAAAELDARATIGSDLGWELLGWSWSPGINQFSGDAFTRGGLEWTMGSGPATDIAVNSAELLKVISTPTFEDIEDDREFYITDDGDWSLNHSDVYEDAELRARYSYSS